MRLRQTEQFKQLEVHEAVYSGPFDQFSVAQLLRLDAQVIIWAPLNVEQLVMTRQVDQPVPVRWDAQIQFQAFRPQLVALVKPVLRRFVG
ncbi:hypothetical protein ASE99_21775 [Serratia sp. Leaf51]|nr:hypothetical protein ASE99_21775 [Serratia sp. Leaf51]